MRVNIIVRDNRSLLSIIGGIEQLAGKGNVVSIELETQAEKHDVLGDVRFINENIIGTFDGIPIKDRY